jgi:hypothetical protein
MAKALVKSDFATERADTFLILKKLFLKGSILTTVG